MTWLFDGHSKKVRNLCHVGIDDSLRLVIFDVIVRTLKTKSAAAGLSCIAHAIDGNTSFECETSVVGNRSVGYTQRPNEDTLFLLRKSIPSSTENRKERTRFRCMNTKDKVALNQ
jgi:hypothetical protein